MPIPVRNRNKESSVLDNMKTAKIDPQMLKTLAKVKSKKKTS